MLGSRAFFGGTFSEMGHATATFNPLTAKSMILRFSMDIYKMISRQSVSL